MEDMQWDPQTSQPNLYPQRRRNQQQQPRTDSSPYFKPSTTTMSERTSDNSDSQPQSTSTSRARRHQGVLTFSDGKLLTKKPLINPISRDDPRRLSMKQVADETWELLPGLLATRPDVTNDSFLCQKQVLDPNRCPRLPPTKVRVIDSDTIDAALDLSASARFPVAILNMANAQHPGGGWRTGSKAQEEAICYRSSLAKTLHRTHYTIPDKAVIYSPSVLIIRDSMKNGHDLLDFRDPRQLEVLSVISCAAVERPPLKKDSKGESTYRNDSDEKLMKEKMRCVLRTAIRNKHQQIVLGALGCGVFANPNKKVAEMWKAVLQEQDFQGGYWRDVVFAVMAGKNDDNLDVFYDILHDLVV